MVRLLHPVEQLKRGLLFGHLVSILAIGHPGCYFFIHYNNSFAERDLLAREEEELGFATDFDKA